MALFRHQYGFGPGFTPILRLDDSRDSLAFGILKLPAGEQVVLPAGTERVYLLLAGRVVFSFDDAEHCAERQSPFNEPPFALHLDAATPGGLIAHAPCELAVCEVNNPQPFAPVLFGPLSLAEATDRGRTLLDGTTHRHERTLFDARNRPEANLVLREVVAFPGRWADYPPHRHPHPELAHFRFTRPQGYGHAECGEEVLKVRQFDTLLVPGNQVHPLVAAPGYAMYYVSALRHLPGQAYGVPEFCREHRWANISDLEN